MRWIYPLFFNAASRVLVIPFVGGIVRYRASYNPKYAAVDSESGLLARPAHTLNGFSNTLQRVYRIEGWAGLYKGFIPTLLETLIIRGSLAFVKVHPAIPLVLIAAPQFGILETFLFVLFTSLIELPITVFMVRAIVTPYKLSVFSPLQSITTLLSFAERQRPYILYTTPGLFAATALQIGLPLIFLHLVFDLAAKAFKNEVGLAVFAAAIVLYIMAFLGSTVILTPLDVMVVRLALQRNRSVSSESEPLTLEGDDGRPKYSDSEEVLLLRDEYNQHRYMGLVDCYKTILAEEGWSALFRAWWFPLIGQLVTVLFYHVLQ